MTKKGDFQDESMFQGVVEFRAEGLELRCMRDGDLWAVYVKRGDAYTRDGAVRVRAKHPSPRSLFMAWRRSNDVDDYDFDAVADRHDYDFD